MKVVIIESNQHPFPYQEGLAVSPGAATAIALRKVKVWKSHTTDLHKYLERVLESN